MDASSLFLLCLFSQNKSIVERVCGISAKTIMMINKLLVIAKTIAAWKNIQSFLERLLDLIESVSRNVANRITVAHNGHIPYV